MDVLKYGLCKECNQPNTDYRWCKSCNAKRFQQNFKNWTSGNHDVDELIQKTQLKARNRKEFLEWVEYNRFENFKYLSRGGFGTIYKADWKGGYVQYWDSENNKWKRNKKDYDENYPVALKCLHESKDITVEFLKEVNYFFL